MNEVTTWIIVIAFYAPLHYMIPLLVLFITGNESNDVRKQLIRRALIDSTLSMFLAFALAIMLVKMEMMIWAMLILLISMPTPFIRILQHRRDITADSRCADSHAADP